MKAISGLVTFAIFACLLTVGVRDVNKCIRAETDRSQRDAWLMDFTQRTNHNTAISYTCMSEMYSLVYKPVDSGPICREYCEGLRSINKMVDSAPIYIDNPDQYRLSLGFCEAKKSVAAR